MNTIYGQCSLFLCPAQYDPVTADTPSLLIELQNIGLISKKINNQNNHFYTGEKFLDYITYLGCAPAIQFEADENNDNFCSIKIHHYKSRKLIVSKTQAKPPQCPECKKPVKLWRDTATTTTINCNHCNTTSRIESYNWRKMAGYAQLFLEVTDIFPKEAIPQPSLMDKLYNITETDWSYFYSCN